MSKDSFAMVHVVYLGKKAFFCLWTALSKGMERWWGGPCPGLWDTEAGLSSTGTV